MPCPGLLHPEPLTLQQATADLYLRRRHSNTVLSQSLWGPWVMVSTRFVTTYTTEIVFFFNYENTMKKLEVTHQKIR